MTLLHSAPVNGQSEIVKYLLSRGMDVDALSVIGTPLALAAHKGYASIVKILLQHNADPNKGNRVLEPLDTALHKSNMSCLKLLIQGGANVSAAGPCYNPLVTAVEKGFTEAIKCLLEAGSNPNVPDKFLRLPIELAAEYGAREATEVLFLFTSSISTVTNWILDGIISHVKMEIKQLEDPPRRHPHIKSKGHPHLPLSFRCQFAVQVPIWLRSTDVSPLGVQFVMQVLIWQRSTGDFLLPDVDFVCDSPEFAKELDVHWHRIPVTVANTTYMGMDTLHAAPGSGRLPAYQYLVEEVKMDINKPDTSQDYSPVEHAVTYSNLPAVRYLLDHGTDLHQQHSGNITLHSAAAHGRSELVKYLLSGGVVVDVL